MSPSRHVGRTLAGFGKTPVVWRELFEPHHCGSPRPGLGISLTRLLYKSPSNMLVARAANSAPSGESFSTNFPKIPALAVSLDAFSLQRSSSKISFAPLVDFVATVVIARRFKSNRSFCILGGSTNRARMNSPVMVGWMSFWKSRMASISKCSVMGPAHLEHIVGENAVVSSEEMGTSGREFRSRRVQAVMRLWSSKHSRSASRIN
mmetsp:Transcript_27999/g.64854  ORF Transcript_27999/g.64854 Transcript_27999/m.64854 type:complete len:206 (-) Transcript_27999:1074-1691(-)